MAYQFGVALEKVQLAELVGQGVSGHVIKSTLPSGHAAAVKVYRFDDIDPAFRPRERFRRECRILSLLEHPSFPALYGCGELQDGTGYALMEWIEGRPLTQYQDAPYATVMLLAYEIASALAALHRLGVVHRDVAFDNVLVEERRFGPYPRLIDLGVAKELDSDEQLTAAGNFLGRPPYASPEQLSEMGAAAVRDPRSDVFSYGVLLYEWLTGEKPFAGQAPADVKRAHRKEPAPFRANPKRGPLDASVEPLVKRMLTLELAGRPTMDEVVHELLELCRLHPQPAPAFEAPVIAGTDGTFRVALQSFPARLQPKRLPPVHLSPMGEMVEGATLGPADGWSTQAGFPMPSPQPQEDEPPPPPPSVARVIEELGAHPKASNWILWFGVGAFVLALVAAALLLL